MDTVYSLFESCGYGLFHNCGTPGLGRWISDPTPQDDPVRDTVCCSCFFFIYVLVFFKLSDLKSDGHCASCIYSSFFVFF